MCKHFSYLSVYDGKPGYAYAFFFSFLAWSCRSDGGDVMGNLLTVKMIWDPDKRYYSKGKI